MNRYLFLSLLGSAILLGGCGQTSQVEIQTMLPENTNPAETGVSSSTGDIGNEYEAETTEEMQEPEDLRSPAQRILEDAFAVMDGSAYCAEGSFTTEILADTKNGEEEVQIPITTECTISQECDGTILHDIRTTVTTIAEVPREQFTERYVLETGYYERNADHYTSEEAADDQSTEASPAWSEWVWYDRPVVTERSFDTTNAHVTMDVRSYRVTLPGGAWSDMDNYLSALSLDPFAADQYFTYTVLVSMDSGRILHTGIDLTADDGLSLSVDNGTSSGTLTYNILSLKLNYHPYEDAVALPDELSTP